MTTTSPLPRSFTGRIRFCTDVKRVIQPDGIYLLVAPGATPVRLSSIGGDIYPLLEAGCELQDILLRIRELYPMARNSEARLIQFLEQLWMSSLLEGSPTIRKSEKPRDYIALFDLDPLCGTFTRVTRVFPSSLLLLVLSVIILIALVGFFRVISSPTRPRFHDFFSHFSLLGLLFVVLIAMPMHELFHGLACGLVGGKVGPLCIRKGFYWWPRLFVQIHDAYLIVEHWRRFSIAVAGLISDLLIAGVAAWLLILIPGGDLLRRAAVFVFMYCVMVINLGTGTLQLGDGSHMLESLLRDPFAHSSAIFGKRSAFTTDFNVRLYRTVTVLHVGLTGALLWYLK